MALAGGDIPELVSEMNQRSAQIRHLETELRAAKRRPDQSMSLTAELEAAAKRKIERLGETMPDDREALRELYLTLFPEGLRFTTAKHGRRKVWSVDGVAEIAESNLGGVPSTAKTPAETRESGVPTHPQNSENAGRAGVSTLLGDPTGN